MEDPSADIRTVTAAYSAFARGDLETLVGLLSDAVQWDATEALWERGLYTGHSGVRAYFERLERMWERLRLDDYEIEPDGPRRFVVRGRLRGFVRGAGQDAPFEHAVEVGADGKIARLKIVVVDERRAQA